MKTGKNDRTRSSALPIAGCLIVMLCVGIIYLWSVFRSPIALAFDMSGAAAKMVSSYMILAFVFGCLFGGFLNDSKGPKFTSIIGIVLFSGGVAVTGLLGPASAGLINITYAVMGGLGSGFAYSACLSCVQKWMPTRRGAASGLAAAAFGLSTTVFAPVSRVLMNVFTDSATGIVNFRPVFFILAGIFFVLGLAACFLIRLPAPDSPQARAAAVPAQSSPNSDMSVGQMLKSSPFWCLFLTMLFGAATWNLALPLLSDLAVDRGLTLGIATLTVSLSGIMNTVGRLVLTTLSDKTGRTSAMVVTSVITVVTALMLMIAGGTSYIIVVMLCAFAYGGYGPLLSAFTVDLFGAKNSGRNFGFVILGLGASSMLFNFVSNHFLHGAVFASFAMGAVTAVIPIMLMVLLRHSTADSTTMHPDVHGGASASA
ncbi:MAG: MFS transporter [Oscillospiraceae bacterium]|nr:MFS transporter [Oscillospiraceae bacterium]